MTFPEDTWQGPNRPAIEIDPESISEVFELRTGGNYFTHIAAAAAE